MSPHYSFLTTDLVTNQVLGEIPVSGVTLDCQLNSAGNMQAGGHLDDPMVSNEDFLARTIPGRTAFWAYRESQIVWGGIIWTRQWQSEGKALTLTGQTFESYAARRFPRSVIGIASQLYNAKQSVIIDQLWLQLQSIVGGSIGVAPYGIYDPSDPTVQLTVNGFDLSTSYDDLIQSIVQNSTGPDYTIIWVEDGNGLPLKQLVVKPRIGNPVGQTQLEVDYPGGAVEGYQYIESATAGNNQWWAIGDGSDVATTVGVATDAAALSSGYPLLEGTNNYSGVTSQATINQHAASDLAALPAPLVTHAADLFGVSAPQFGTYGMGDYVVAHVTDPRFPAGFDFGVRAIGWSIQTPDGSEGTEKISLVYDESTGGGV